jgi:hypothetical protein
MARSMLLAAAALFLVLIACGYGVLLYMTSMPGKPHRGPLPPLTDEERLLAALLKKHIETIAAHEHNMAYFAQLEDAARYIEAQLESYGYTVNRQSFVVDEATVRNIDVVIEPSDGTPAPEVLVVGAHYDSVRGAPGANDNATGAAAVIELARLLVDLKGMTSRRIRLALFVNEEPPYFQTDEMGSLHYASALAERKERVVAMYSLETLGFYSSEPGSQHYPFPFGLMFPNRGDFVAFVAMTESRPLLRESIRSFRSHTAFPTVGGVAPSFVPGIDWSDHWAFAEQRFPAIMLTDTAYFRYPHYHRPTDTPDKIDVNSLARVVKGIERMLRDAAR